MAILDAQGHAVTRVAICLPVQDVVASGFALDLASLTGSIPAGIAWTVLQSRGTILPQQRTTLVKLALQWGATHVLWLDGDMRFPADTLERLLAHGLPIVAANYSARRPPILPTAADHELGMLFTMPEDQGLVDVTHCGMGVMLVQSHVYHDVPTPWFALGYSKKDEDFVGEDVYFCRKAKDHGFPTRVDQHLSQAVRHIGEFEFTARHAVLTRDASLAPVA